ncbi:MAG: MmgE/PrpD family protein [Betaproteobacteria bacterium]|nr:MmgE/PrpD family protein [Betaproteobacteria bacterium]
MEFGLTLAEYVKGVTLDKVPQRDIEVAKLAILDQVGVALAGVGEDPGVKVQDMVNRCAANEATVLGTPRKTTTWLAALVNGTLGHTLDFDDCSSFGHPSVVLVPAMLATGETQDRSGRELLEAYIAGYEVGEALSRIVPRRADQFHGLHSTAMFGPLTSATVSGRLLNLNAAQQRHAWGIAASQAGGITGNFGTHTKPLHGGIASQAGVMAAELAASGFEANPDALDAPLGYISSVVAAGRMEGVDVAKATAELDRWHIADTWRLKKYPCGYIAQGAIDAALRFRQESGLRLEDLSSVEIRVPHLQPYFRVRPTGEFSGKFGYEYPVACAILDGEVVKKSFSDQAFNRPEIKRNLTKFRTLEDPASKERGPLGVLVIEAKGKTMMQPIEIPLGDAKRPVPPAQVVEKYVRNAGEVVGTDVARQTAQVLLEIETLSSIRPLLDRLAKRS